MPFYLSLAGSYARFSDDELLPSWEGELADASPFPDALSAEAARTRCALGEAARKCRSPNFDAALAPFAEAAPLAAKFFASPLQGLLRTAAEAASGGQTKESFSALDSALQILRPFSMLLDAGEPADPSEPRVRLFGDLQRSKLAGAAGAAAPVQLSFRDAHELTLLAEAEIEKARTEPAKAASVSAFTAAASVLCGEAKKALALVGQPARIGVRIVELIPTAELLAPRSAFLALLPDGSFACRRSEGAQDRLSSIRSHAQALLWPTRDAAVAELREAGGDFARALLIEHALAPLSVFPASPELPLSEEGSKLLAQFEELALMKASALSRPSKSEPEALDASIPAPTRRL